MSDAPNQDKRKILDTFLDEGMVLIQLDSRIETVEVPSYLREDAKLRLNLSGRFGLPLHLDEWGVHATLTFRGTPFECNIPWGAIYIIISHSSGEPKLFPDDIPEEFVADALGTTYQEETPEGAPPYLRLVDEKAEGTPAPEPKPAIPLPVQAAPEKADEIEPPEPDPDPPTGGPGKRRHLSVVK